MAFSDLMSFAPAEEQTKAQCYDAGAAAAWDLISQFLATTVAERKLVRVENVSTIADLMNKYTPESLARAVKSIEELRDSVNFHQGDILVNASGVRITVITNDNATTANKEGVTSNGKCYTITNVYNWTKTGETNKGLIAALDDVDTMDTPPEGGE